MIDSIDRTSVAASSFSLADNFIIQKNQSILNGFFHRIATTEVVMDWKLANINGGGDNTLTVQVVAIGSPIYTVSLEPGFYTVAEALDDLVVELNAAGTGLTWSINTGTGGDVYLAIASGAFTVLDSPLASRLGLRDVTPLLAVVDNPDLRKYNYVDFVSEQLTYNQQLKDASTARKERNVLCRWYMSWDNPPTLDTYGFPILMGYTEFNVRRIFSPPKQIRWENNMPVGQLAFQVYGDTGNLLGNDVTLNPRNFNWLMTLQVSED
jgi:hypothetical protein